MQLKLCKYIKKYIEIKRTFLRLKFTTKMCLYLSKKKITENTILLSTGDETDV